jgi:hypothetical protein
MRPSRDNVARNFRSHGIDPGWFWGVGPFTVTRRASLRANGINTNRAVMQPAWNAACVPIPNASMCEELFRRIPPLHLKDSVPRLSEGRNLAAFYNATDTAMRTASVSGDDGMVSFFHPLYGAHIYTNWVTKPGDSGAMLFADDGEVMGIALFETEDGVEPAMSGWLCAYGIAQALQIRFKDLSAIEAATLDSGQ